MAYVVSARKWRPQKFDEVVGQKHIITTLKNAISGGRVAGSYIFSGTRGVGKTTTARILAKALNCIDAPTISPCGKCKPCKEIKIGSSLDVIEIDGASNRGIDDIRSLRDKVKYAPSAGKYKVYIIDEVHMLTKEAFNALLKTLEEPPPHVTFVFATTEIKKVPDTILSRCQWFDFKSLTISDIVKQLAFIASNDGITITKEYLEIVAKNAAGSMRDAQMLFDQIISFSGKNVKEDDIKKVLGLIDKSLLDKTVISILNKDCGELIEIVADMRKNGCDINLFHKDLIEYFRNMMIIKVTGNKTSETIIASPHELKTLKGISANFTEDHIHRIFAILLELEKDLKQSSLPEIVIEMALIKMAQLVPIIPVDSVLEKIDNMQLLLRERSFRRTGQPVTKTTEPISPPIEQKDSIKVITTRKAKASIEKTCIPVPGNKNLKEKWDLIIEEVGYKKGSLPGFLGNGTLLDVENSIKIGFDKNNSFHSTCIDIIKQPENSKIISEVSKVLLGKDLKVEITFIKDVEKTTVKKPSNIEHKQRITDPSTEIDSRKKKVIFDALDIFNGNIV